MGTLTYDSSLEAQFDDRALAHLRVVIGAKMRRNESFYLTWHNDDRASTVWLHPAIPLSFTFDGGGEIPINYAWIEDLMRVANSASGLRVGPEPAERAQRSA